MMITKQRVKKIDGRQFYYFVQSISGDDDLRHQEVKVVITTHIDTNHLHNYLVGNSVSCENGRKLH